MHVLNAMCMPASGGQPPHKQPSEPNTDNFFALATMLLKSCDPAQVRLHSLPGAVRLVTRNILIN